MDVLIVGSLAYDSIASPLGAVENALSEVLLHMRAYPVLFIVIDWILNPLVWLESLGQISETKTGRFLKTLNLIPKELKLSKGKPSAGLGHMKVQWVKQQRMKRT